MKELFIEENISTAKENCISLLWNDFNSDQNNNIFSINKILEENSFFYRRKILSIGKVYLNRVWRKSKLNYILDKKFDYFFLSSIFHQSSFHKNSLHLLITKFFVVREFIKKKNFSKININIVDKNFSNLIYEYCIFKNIKVERNNLYKSRLSFLNFGQKIHYIKQIILLLTKVSFKQKKFKVNTDDVLVFDVFTHFDLDALKNGKYKSFYWNSLVEIINKNKIKMKWIHLFYPTKNIKFLSDANKITNILNKEEKNTNHFILENLFSLKSGFVALIKYLKVLKSYLLYKNSLKIKKNSAFSAFNKILNHYIIDTFLGYRSLRNIFFYECFNNLIKKNNKPKLGLYLMENLDFELILNHLWKKKFDSHLIGFPHSNVRHWDLRYFFLDPNKYKDIYPNKVLIHSKDTFDWAQDIKLKNTNSFGVESLRYENLILTKRPVTKKNFKKFLVFGDIDKDITEALLGVFENNQDKQFFVKNHPGSSINKQNYKNIFFINNNDHNFDNYDCVIVSNASGAVFKPYYENFPFLVFLDTRFFNLNPISNLNKNIFFYDHASFEDALIYAKEKNIENKKLHIVDKRNLEWLKILKNEFSDSNFSQIDFQKLLEMK